MEIKRVINLTIPYKNFQTGTIISATQMNENLQVIEAKVNQIIEEENTTSNLTVDEIKAICEGNAFIDYSNGYVTSTEIGEIIASSIDQELVDSIIMRTVRGAYITEKEIESIVKGGTI